jgi:hypothetical protein
VAEVPQRGPASDARDGLGSEEVRVDQDLPIERRNMAQGPSLAPMMPTALTNLVGGILCDSAPR